MSLTKPMYNKPKKATMNKTQIREQIAAMKRDAKEFAKTDPAISKALLGLVKILESTS